MCGRFTISKTEQELEKRFGANFYSRVLEARYNIAPTRNSPVITSEEPGTFQFFRWGLIPFWAKDQSIGLKMINARIETVQEKPAFRQAWLKRRCLVVADSWYEWIPQGKRKQPYRILRKDREAFAFAGLWESWNPAGKGRASDPGRDEARDPGRDQGRDAVQGRDATSNPGIGQGRDPDQTLHSFTIITQPALPAISHIHDRMPAILLPGNERLWLDHNLPEQDITQLLLPYPEEELSFYPVSDAVNNARNEDPGLLEPVEPPGVQGGLFD